MGRPFVWYCSDCGNYVWSEVEGVEVPALKGIFATPTLTALIPGTTMQCSNCNAVFIAPFFEPRRAGASDDQWTGQCCPPGALPRPRSYSKPLDFEGTAMPKARKVRGADGTLWAVRRQPAMIFGAGTGRPPARPEGLLFTSQTAVTKFYGMQDLTLPTDQELQRMSDAALLACLDKAKICE